MARFVNMTQPEPQPQLATLNDVLPLRAQVLRPGQDRNSAIFEADRDPVSEPQHWLIRDHQQVLSVASTYLRPLPAQAEAFQAQQTNQAQQTHLAEQTHQAQPVPASTGQISWRQLRGMATHPSAQGHGYGRTLLQAICTPTALTEALDQRPTSGHQVAGIWCNARRSAVGFYESFGFVCRSSEFEIAGVGPHYVMEFRVA